MSNPQFKAETRLHIYDGISVETVKREGSTGQKIAVSLFDEDQNGILEGYEAERMNRCNFKSEPGKLTIFEDKGDKKNRVMEIKYGNLDELYAECQNVVTNDINSFSFGEYEKEGKKYLKYHFSKLADYEKISIDMPAGKVTVQGAKGSLFTRDIELTVKDSDLNGIYASGGKVNLENVKNEGLLIDSATEVRTDGTTIVKGDADSNYDISTEEE